MRISWFPDGSKVKGNDSSQIRTFLRNGQLREWNIQIRDFRNFFFEISIFLSHDVFQQNDGLESLVAGASPVIHLDQTQPVYSTLRAPGRHGSKNEVLNSGTRLENVEYKKLSAPGSQLDPEKLNPPKVGFFNRCEKNINFLSRYESELSEQANFSIL